MHPTNSRKVHTMSSVYKTPPSGYSKTRPDRAQEAQEGRKTPQAPKKAKRETVVISSSDDDTDELEFASHPPSEDDDDDDDSRHEIANTAAQEEWQEHLFEPTSDTTRSHNWVATINNPSLNIGARYMAIIYTTCNAAIDAKHISYAAWAKEQGTFATPHIHMAIRTTKQVRRISLIKILKAILTKAWISMASTSATWDERVNYFKYLKGEDLIRLGHNKGDTVVNETFDEVGSFPEPEAARQAGRRKGGEATKARYQECISLATSRKLGELRDMHADLYVIHLPKWISIANQQRPPDRQNLPDTWIYGKSGIGKSKWVRDEAIIKQKQLFVKSASKWWDGYNNQPWVLIEDIDPSTIAVRDMKILTDHYAFPAEIKGGSINVRPQRVFFTSNYSMAEIWPNEKDLEPITRRVKERTVRQGVLVMPSSDQGFAASRAAEPFPKTTIDLTARPASPTPDHPINISSQVPPSQPREDSEDETDDMPTVDEEYPASQHKAVFRDPPRLARYRQVSGNTTAT